ncbi:MAG: hypothetical protein KC502_13350 [Myxococcales bacterium]|nr:hypothetical protein [Myxococcales bacterium]
MPRWTALLLSLAVVACQRAPAEAPEPASQPASRSAVSPPAQVTATDLDPSAMDEALRQALVDLRSRFRCNSISGCKAHGVLVSFGERARLPVQRLFNVAPRQASWRARSVRIVAEMQRPAARPFLREVLKDNSDRARAYAVYGLALLNDRRDLALMTNYANAPGIIASAMTRVAAAWALGYWGDRSYTERFVALVHEAAAHQLGGATLRWSLELCRVPNGPSCSGALEMAAGHPSYVVRREVLRSVGRDAVSIRALVTLAGDPNANLARRAEKALRRVSGRHNIVGAQAWRTWCQAGACATPKDH